MAGGAELTAEAVGTAAMAAVDAPWDHSLFGPSYAEQAQTKSLCTLSALARRLHAARTEGGALRLASPEVKFKLGAQDGAVPEAAANAAPTEMACYLPVEANSMVEEFMLLANITVAKAILEAYPESALLRRHPHPQVPKRTLSASDRL